MQWQLNFNKQNALKKLEFVIKSPNSRKQLQIVCLYNINRFKMYKYFSAI